MKKAIFAILISSLIFSSMGWDFINIKQLFKKDLPTVDKVDINRFKGHWYEIARLGNSAEENCLCPQQEVILEGDKIIANDTCFRDSLFGDQDVETFEMVPLDDTFAKFKTDKVSDYYIIDLDEENYNYAMIGDPSRDFLWIVSRQPVLSADRILELLTKARDLEFDVDKIHFEGQVCGNIFDATSKDLPTVDSVELEKFVGHWYEIARLPFKEERGCLCSQELLTLRKGKVAATHTCRRGCIDAKIESCNSTLVPEDETNAKFEIKEEGLELYVVDLDKTTYSWALVADPRRTHLWIKSRNPTIDYEVIKRLVRRAKELDFPVEKLIFTPQVCGNNYF